MSPGAEGRIRRRLRRLFPFLSWIGELRDPEILRADVLAGLSVAMMLPQGMANAQLADLPAYFGLYSAFLPPAIAALFGSSRQVFTGSVALVSLMTAAALKPIVSPGTPDFIVYAVLLAFIVGAIQLGLGALRMGSLVNLLSHPVVLGFTNAGAVVIATSQTDEVFGVTVHGTHPHVVWVWKAMSAAAAGPHWPTLGMAALSFALILTLRRFYPRWPAVLVSVLVATVISKVVGFEQVMGGRVVGTIPVGLPDFRVPPVHSSVVLHLIPSAVAIALIGFVGTISVARSVALQTRQRVSANQELIGQGLSNLVGSFFQSYPVSCSFARTAVNLRAGARTGASAMVSSLVVASVLLWFTPLLYHLPLATLAAIIIVSVTGLLQFEAVKRAWRVHRHDGVIAVGTFVATLAFAPNLVVGVAFGVVLSLVLYLSRTMRPRVAILSRHTDGSLRDAEVFGLETCRNICVIRFDGSLYFGSVGYFEDRVLRAVAQYPELKFLVVDAQGMNPIDAAGEEILQGVAGRVQDEGVEVLLANANQQIVEALARTGSIDRIGRDKVFPLMAQALSYAWSRLEDGHAADCPLQRARPKGWVPNYKV